MSRALIVAGAAVLALVLLLAVQALITMRREYPFEGFERIRATVGQGAQPPLRLAMLGDSTVAGVGAATQAGSLPVLTAERVAAALGRPVEVVGAGVSGARTGDVAAQAEQLGRFDIVVVVIGSNDVTGLTSPWRLRAATRTLLDGLEAPAVLGGIPLFGSADALPRPLRDVVGWYAGVLRARQAGVAAEREDVEWVDIAAEASPRFRGVPEAMSADGYHPSPVGYGFWADALAAGVVRALTP